MGSAPLALLFLLTTFCVFYAFFSMQTPVQISSTKNYQSISSPEVVNVIGTVKNVSVIKSSKWIVVTTIQGPTKDVKRLSTLKEWNLVVVADRKTPANWNLPGVHFLDVQMQETLPFILAKNLPFASYTRKNIGYLYAIALGAEWIYDTDDDNKPFGKGLEQFDYKNTVSGVRFTKNRSSADFSHRLFNPYRFFGNTKLWPRGFPLQLIHEHNNGERLTLCRTMRRAAIQQGLVQRDPDVDAIYRLLEADRVDGLDERFNKFAPPVTLAPGTFSPWNSQNTLFHKSAFHTLFLPTTVSFRTTDIWRSYFAQPLLHLAGDTVSFVPVNAIQKRNSHNYLKDFEEERQVFEQSGAIVAFMDAWKCNYTTVSQCQLQLAKEFSSSGFWKAEDERLMGIWGLDLFRLGYEFPRVTNSRNQDPYTASVNEADMQVNCRRMDLTVFLDAPRNSSEPAMERAVQKLNAVGDFDDWCHAANVSVPFHSLPSPNQLASKHAESEVLASRLNQVLIITNNWPWKQSIGVLQRMYQPFFGLVIFCGSWYPENYDDAGAYPVKQATFNYVHVNPKEIGGGYFAYHCATLVREMNLNDVQGYFVMADDAIFNIWQRVDVTRVFHPTGLSYFDTPGPWWPSEYGSAAAERVIKVVSGTTDSGVKATWQEFENGLRSQGYVKSGSTINDAASEMRNAKSWSVSDFYYLPSTKMDYFARLMRLFYDGTFFHELAINKFLRSVPHQTSREGLAAYLWDGDRNQWTSHYNADLVSLHPVKFSYFAQLAYRSLFCNTVLKTFVGALFDNSTSYTVKNDADVDYKNG